MDDLRKIQKSHGADGSSKQAGKYGCACCRRIANLNKHKKVTRKIAKRQLRQRDRKEFIGV